MNTDLIYEKDINLITKSGIPVTIKLHRFKVDPPDSFRGGKLSYFEKYDFWTQANRRRYYIGN